ncbi:MAG: PEP-CTERM sorting domain-containing protein [Candidatus Eisenbacteria bacterium]|nr:PEP-CTERM sorting domain-containing protein [Candidatus Eisenbacteria bacterium]
MPTTTASAGPSGTTAASAASIPIRTGASTCAGTVQTSSTSRPRTPSSWRTRTSIPQTDTDIGPHNLAMVDNGYAEGLFWIGFETSLEELATGEEGSLTQGGQPGYGPSYFMRPSGGGFWTYANDVYGTLLNSGPAAPPIPEPGTLVLLSMGLLGSAAVLRRLRAK